MHVAAKDFSFSADLIRRGEEYSWVRPMAEKRLMTTAARMSADLYETTGELVTPLPAVQPSAGDTHLEDQAANSGFLARVGAFVVSTYRSFKHRRRLSGFKKALQAEPDSITLLNSYSNYLESKGMRDEAAGVYGRLVSICRRQREVDQAAVYCRKLDIVGNRDAARCYRELASLHSELGRFEDASRAVKRVVELYLEEGQKKAAEGYIRQLPPLGSRADSTRAELTRMTIEFSAHVDEPARPVLQLVSGEPHGQEPIRPAYAYTTNPLASTVAMPEEDVFLSGHLGRITPFDVVQIVESNSLTGRLDFLTAPVPGAIFFRDGHIVAAISGSKRGHDALRAVFTADPSPFRVVVTEHLPEEEFKVINNTGLLLDIIREIDEAAENDHPILVRPGQDDFFV
jgi:tetratricopeptide (TPR) repeat protein